MFANTYQNGYYTEVWDSRVNAEKNPAYKQLFKKVPSSLKNFYDKELEGNERLSFPHDDRQQNLSLHQRYLVIQIFIPFGSNWSIELGINDITNAKKRINITTTSGKQELKYFSLRYPLQNGLLEKGIWMFLAIDIYSFCNAFKNTVFRSLDSIVVCSCCKIRRIFTMKEWTEFQIPKNYWLPSNLPQTMQLIDFKQIKQSIHNLNVISSTIQQSKMMESKMVENPSSVLRNSQKSQPLQQKHSQKGGIKLPGVNTRSKDLTPLKASKLSQKIEVAVKNDLTKDFGMLGKSNRSITKADIIIQKSKIRLNSLQEKQDQIINRLKSEQNRFSDKLPIKQSKKYLKGQNLFKSDLFRSGFSQSRGSESKITKINSHSPKVLKIKRSFEEDNIFKEESYQSSFSRRTEKQSGERLRSNINGNQSLVGSRKNGPKISQAELNELEESSDSLSKLRGLVGFGRDQKQSKVSLRGKEREEIIEEDVWTEEEDGIKPETPIEEIIQSQQHVTKFPARTIISRQNNQEVRSTQPLNSLKAPSELELIYDEMIGCYYHPQTMTYYEIKK